MCGNWFTHQSHQLEWFIAHHFVSTGTVVTCTSEELQRFHSFLYLLSCQRRTSKLCRLTIFYSLEDFPISILHVIYAHWQEENVVGLSMALGLFNTFGFITFADLKWFDVVCSSPWYHTVPKSLTGSFTTWPLEDAWQVAEETIGDSTLSMARWDSIFCLIE